MDHTDDTFAPQTVREYREYAGLDDPAVQTATDEILDRMAKDLCEAHYLTVDPGRPTYGAWAKINPVTRDRWRRMAAHLTAHGWGRR